MIVGERTFELNGFIKNVNSKLVPGLEKLALLVLHLETLNNSINIFPINEPK